MAKAGYSGRIDEKPRIRWGPDGGDQNRVAYPDFVLRDERAPAGVLVELKANLSSSAEADRALGQMLRYLLAWKKEGPAMLVVCGSAPPEIRFLIRWYIDAWRKTLRLPVTVYILRDDTVPVADLARMPADG